MFDVSCDEVRRAFAKLGLYVEVTQEPEMGGGIFRVELDTGAALYIHGRRAITTLKAFDPRTPKDVMLHLDTFGALAAGSQGKTSEDDDS